MTEENAKTATSSVFISYSRKDKRFVSKLNYSLDASGVDARVDWEGDTVLEHTCTSTGAYTGTKQRNMLPLDNKYDRIRMGSDFSKRRLPSHLPRTWSRG